ncbi:hypothetical protein Tco_1478081, partial [Tanacetum coccineum]
SFLQLDSLNSHAKIFYIRKQQEPGKPKEEVYSNSKIVQIIKTYWELGHEHKFITEIVARRENGCIVSITESDYKNLNKNDIEDIYLLIINHKVNDYAETGLLWSLSVFTWSTVIWERVHDFQLGVESYQQQVNLTAPTITFPGIKKYKRLEKFPEDSLVEVEEFEVLSLTLLKTQGQRIPQEARTKGLSLALFLDDDSVSCSLPRISSFGLVFSR